jgi:hypothetical protein
MSEIVKYKITITKDSKEEEQIHIADYPSIERLVEKFYSDGADAVELELLETHNVKYR